MFDCLRMSTVHVEFVAIRNAYIKPPLQDKMVLCFLSFLKGTVWLGLNEYRQTLITTVQ